MSCPRRDWEGEGANRFANNLTSIAFLHLLCAPPGFLCPSLATVGCAHCWQDWSKLAVCLWGELGGCLAAAVGFPHICGQAQLVVIAQFLQMQLSGTEMERLSVMLATSFAILCISMPYYLFQS